MSTNALSGHGTKIDYQVTPGPGAAFTEIGELGDITPPGLSRNGFDATTQNEDIDSYVHGVLRREEVTIKINSIPTNATHDHLTGLGKYIINNTTGGFRFRFPDGTQWIASGQVSGLKPTAPVDGLMSADVTVRFSGRMMIGGVSVG